MADTAYSPAALDSLLNPLRRVYLLYGEDDRQKDEFIQQVRAAVVEPSFAEFDCEVIEAGAAGLDAILASAAQAPFASSHRLVIVRGAELWKKRERAADAEALAEALPRLGPYSCLILTAGSGDDPARSRTAIHAKVDAAVSQSGIVLRFDEPSSDAMVNWLMDRARSAGKTLADEAAESLVHAAQGDRWTLENELEKVLCYSGPRASISLEDVEAVCSYEADDVMFKLVDAVTARNADRALRLLDEVLRFDIRPQVAAGRLLALLQRQLRLLWQARELKERGVQARDLRNLPAAITDELPSEGSIQGMAWKSADLFRAASTWDRSRLMQAFELLLNCDLSNKGGPEGSEDTVTNLELVIVRLCGKG